MGFNKRFLSEEGIRNTAKHYKDHFQWFQRYMVYADGYILEDSWASKIFEQFGEFGEDSEERKILHQQIVNGEI